ncbi:MULTISPECIES: glycosyltransferase family 61 protein [Clostridium]|uniref:Glycosyltransferase family 61 protein n=1 Tax=Clostridium frigoriphilum TaxID=443253 RepID=A0ABU7UVB5_9CLOT|nr:glycosyltransferase family 61 protein [Clostridium sp. DSM 17811]MBU3101636.1 glycosyltransferase family 61 protein [Clostridium sp. DSM 17811]
MNIEKRLKNISCKEYCNIHNFEYSIQQKEYTQKVYIPDYRDSLEVNNYVYAKYPETYIAELYNVNLIGGNSLIFDKNDNCIYDLPLMDDENRFELRCGNALFVDKNVTIVYYDNSTEIIEEGIMLIANASFNYFHFNLESLSKLCFFDEIGEYDKVPILVDERCLRIQSFKDELDMLNSHGREIVYLKQGCSYNVKKLVYLSDLIISPMNFKKDVLIRYDDYIMNEVAVKLLHDKLSINSNITKKLFISRRNCSLIRLTNQNEIEQIFKEYGYEVIYPEEMSFQDQLKTFSEAEFIAGASGAGFTNILFANKNAKIICILPKEIKLTCYSNIAGVLGQECYYLDAKIHYNTSTVYYQDSFELEEDYLRKFLEGFKY